MAAGSCGTDVPLVVDVTAPADVGNPIQANPAATKYNLSFIFLVPKTQPPRKPSTSNRALAILRGHPLGDSLEQIRVTSQEGVGRARRRTASAEIQDALGSRVFLWLLRKQIG